MKLRFEKGDRQIPIFYVWNSNDECLGNITFYKKWKCWVWSQDQEVIMSSDCLQQIADKLKELDKEVKGK